MQSIRWGILGTGTIAGKFAVGLSALEDASLAAVGSRTAEKAQAFAAEYGAAKAYGSYAELVHDPDIDVVYVAVPHSAHRECAMLALDAGKAVLCEKPFTLNAAQLGDLIAKARDSKLFLMEAMWTRFLPAVGQVRRWLRDGAIGEVRAMRADFGFRAAWEPQGRLLNIHLGGGALLDVGVYSVSFASMVLGAHPETVQSTACLGETGVDEQFMMMLTYSGGQIASLGGAARTRMVNDAWIFGTQGRIHVPDFFCARSAVLFADDHEPVTCRPDFAGNGYNYEAAEVARCLRSGLPESPVMPLDESAAIMKILDRARAAWGLKYPQE